MTFHIRACSSVVAILGLAAMNVLQAQPIAPARPGYSSYGSMFRPGGSAYYGYGGQGLQYRQMQMQNQMFQQQMNITNQALTNMQMFMAFGVNPNMPITGRSATFDNLGHWYPGFTGSGIPGGGGGGGGLAMPRMSMPAPSGGGGMGAAPGGPGGGAPAGGAGVRR